MGNQVQQQKKNDDNSDLIIYRLDRVEAALNTLNAKFDSLSGPTKSDFLEFRSGLMQTLSNYQTETNKALDKKADLEEFILVKRIVFGAVAVILIAVLGGFLALIGLKAH